MKRLPITVLKTALTVGIFVSLFVEFGGGKEGTARERAMRAIAA